MKVSIRIVKEEKKKHDRQMKKNAKKKEVACTERMKIKPEKGKMKKK